MKQLFDELLLIEGVEGALLFNDQGVVAYRGLAGDAPHDPAGSAWWLPFVNTLNGIQELELLYSAGRVFIRRTANGYLMIWMGAATPVAMVRLNCDILLHGLPDTTSKRRRGGFFSRRV